MDPSTTQRTLSKFQDAPHAFITTEPLLPLHGYIIIIVTLLSYIEDTGNSYWHASTYNEINTLIQTWELIPLLPKKKLVPPDIYIKSFIE